MTARDTALCLDQLKKEKGLNVALSRPLQSKENRILIRKGQLLTTTHVTMPSHAQKSSPDRNPNTYPTLYGRIEIAPKPDPRANDTMTAFRILSSGFVRPGFCHCGRFASHLGKGICQQWLVL